MGRDKALLPFRGGHLAQAVAAEVSRAAGSAVLVGNPERYAGLGFAVVADRFPGEGPLGGILTALQHSRADWNLLVACDMPGVTAPILIELLAAAGRRRTDVLVAAGPSGLLEPLCAVYHRRSEPALQAAFDRGTRKITTALRALRTGVLHLADAAPFQNVNTPEEWDRCAAD